MSKRYSLSLFIFRRDLRLIDNTGLNAALQKSARVLLCFVFDPRQIESHDYQSQPGLQFMLESLLDLRRQIQQQGGRLFLFEGLPHNILVQLHRLYKIEAVFVNRDYTPFSRQRDADLSEACIPLGIHFHSHSDLLLNEPELVTKSDGSPYKVFTAFYRNARQRLVTAPQALSSDCFVDSQVDDLSLIERFRGNHRNSFSGGRCAALLQMDRLTDCREYIVKRDFPALSATSNLSVYLKFGCCSIREAYAAVITRLGEDHPLLRQFYWRDFFTYIAFHFPMVFGQAFDIRYEAVVWRNDQNEFRAWQEGLSGFPIVDAGMRELKQTGCLHNRLRMIVASFLVKDLQIDWRWGERHFAQQLLDYDPCVNNGNWQWAASTGCDAQPYFRIFNPWLQQRKFDADCTYIKRWLPELRVFPPSIIHHWYRKTLNSDYPGPIVDHRARAEQSRQMFRSLVNH
ncbi:MAG: cryptochrome/photolyase family protein [Gammaproteobacteria bacterium]